jgi:hypothetical protein
MSELLTLARMARRLGVAAQWLRAQADTGQVPCLRAGTRYLSSPAAVADALAVMASRPTPTREQPERRGGDDDPMMHPAAARRRRFGPKNRFSQP